LNENEEEMIVIMIKMKLNDCNHDCHYQEMILIIFNSKLKNFGVFFPWITGLN